MEKLQVEEIGPYLAFFITKCELFLDTVHRKNKNSLLNLPKAQLMKVESDLLITT